VHFPMGGQGLNLGLQDAMNLGWKLAAVLRSAAPPALLDTYELERAPVGRAVIDDTLAQTALIAVPGREGQALRGMMTTMLAENPALNSRLALSAAGIGVTYPAVTGTHPLVGCRVPNLRLKDGPDVFELLQHGKFCLIGLPPSATSGALGAQILNRLSVAPGGFATDRQPWDQVGAALIRPDGHLAWAADRDSADFGADASADAAAELLRWLPGLTPASDKTG
jgi:hypothetical protein